MRSGSLAPSSTSDYSHAEQEEVYVVVAGSDRAKLNEEIVELASGMYCGSPPG